MYPEFAVLTAVSMRPSRPPIAWKKNSCGERPCRYEFSTKPLHHSARRVRHTLLNTKCCYVLL